MLESGLSGVQFKFIFLKNRTDETFTGIKISRIIFSWDQTGQDLDLTSVIHFVSVLGY